MKTVLSHPFAKWITVFLLVASTTAATGLMLQGKPSSTYDPALTAQGVQAVAALAALNEPVQPVADSQAPPSIPAKPLEKPLPKPLSDRIVEYHMNVELDAAQKSLRGNQTLTWRNPGAKPVSELYFHLYPNAFASKKSTFVRESGGQLRGDKMKDNSFGNMQITSMKLLTGEDLLPRLEYVQPDDGNKDDKTLVKLPLPKIILPGEKITLKTDFSVQLPATFARMGYTQDFIMAGQWFPKLAVYEPVGTRGRPDEGWNAHQYHGNSEFYADFGIYEVTVKVPSKYTVAATGFPIKPPFDDGQSKTYTFYADDVHDFAWAASPNFVYVEEPYATPNLPGVKIKLYLDPLHEDLKARYLTAAKKALARYSQWYGSYPYSTLSIVVPPKGGGGAGGMEYPTLVTSWSAEEADPDLELERVLVHEIGHQYWYGMVASNEFEEAWLDEGLTSYSEDKIMETEYGSRPNLAVESSYITSPEALKQNAWNYHGHDGYAENVYTRAKLVLKSIERQIGPEQMDRVMKSYFTRFKFKHPTTADFQRVLEDTTKADWSDFFRQYVFGGMMTDFTIDGIYVKKQELNGVPSYESTVVVSKRGGSYGYVPIHFHFADGTGMDRVWEGKADQTEFKLTHTAPVDWAVIDPQHTNVLETKHINSFMKKDIDPKLALRWNLGSVKLLETLFSWVAW